MTRKIFTALAGFAISGVFGAALPASAQTAQTEQEAHAIGIGAYLYFYAAIFCLLKRPTLRPIRPRGGR